MEQQMSMNPEPELTRGMNESQRQAAVHVDGPILVAAVAGSGKTRVLVHRIALLIALGHAASRVLAVTFSKRAATEMNERLKRLVPDTEARVGTFHSLAYEIVRAERPASKDWTVDAKNHYRFCVKDATGFRHMKWNGADASFLEGFISFAKSEMLLPEDPETLDLARDFATRIKGRPAMASQMVQAYSIAEDLRREKRLITFDDMMLEGTLMLRDDEAIRTRWAGRWDYVLQDEAQDQSKSQLLMGELLAKDHRNYMVVGDVSQAIYSFRGAHPQTLVEFPAKWGAKVINMAQNYRCAPEIVAIANRSLEAMKPSERVSQEPMVAESKTQGHVALRQYADMDEEGVDVARQCKVLHEDGTDWRDVAVMYRTNAQSRAVEEAMIEQRIPYRIIGGTNFYERREVRDLLAYLRLAEGRGKIDDVVRCINAPFRFLGKAFIEKVVAAGRRLGKQARSRGERLSWAEAVMVACDEGRVQYRQRTSAEEWSSMIEYVQTAAKRGGEESRPANILAYIVKTTRYNEWLSRDEGEESVSNSRVSNVIEMIRAATRFNTATELLDYVDDMIEASRNRRGGKDPDKVVLQSIHSAKGLEYDSTFIIGCNEKILPHGRALDIEEERRLFYVGVTRAKRNLGLSCVQTAAFGSKVLDLFPSRFLDEVGLRVEDE